MKIPKNAIVKLPEIKDRDGDLSKDWYVSYGVRDPKTGIMQTFRKSTGINKHATRAGRMRVANAIIKELEGKLKNGWNPIRDKTRFVFEDQLEYKTNELYVKAKKSNKNFHFCVQGFIKIVQRKNAESTISTYTSKFRIFGKWLELKEYHEYDISCISHNIIVEFFEHLIDVRKISQNTHRKYRQLLTEFFNYLIEEKIIRVNPVEGRLPETTATNEKPIWPIRQGDIEKLKTELKKDKWMWLATLLQYYCALRPGRELRLLKIKDFDLYEGTVRVTADNAKKEKRIVIIPDLLLDLLRADYKLDEYPAEYYLFGKNEDNKYEPAMRVIGKNNMRSRFRRIREECNMPEEYKFYSWKHTGAMALIKSGANLYDISVHLGHNDKSSTEAYIKNKFGEQSDFIRNHYPPI